MNFLTAFSCYDLDLQATSKNKKKILLKQLARLAVFFNSVMYYTLG